VASNSASKRQQRSSDSAIAEQQRQYDIAREDQSQYRRVGNQALQTLAGEMGFAGGAGQRGETFDEIRARLQPEFSGSWYGGNNVDDAGLDIAANQELARQKAMGLVPGQVTPGQSSRTDYAADVMRDPGYQFGLQQGQQALDRKVAAMGGRVSGAALKAAARYGTDYASTGYNAAYQRGQDRLNRLAAMAGLGQTATQASAQSGANATNAISNLMSSQGNASAAATMAQGNIWGNAANQLAGYYMNQQRQPQYQPMRNNTYDTGYTGVGGGGGYGSYGDASGTYMTVDGGG
jgi:hypothetical protein